jgi:hypothetical protein
MRIPETDPLKKGLPNNASLWEATTAFFADNYIAGYGFGLGAIWPQPWDSSVPQERKMSSVVGPTPNSE